MDQKAFRPEIADWENLVLGYIIRKARWKTQTKEISLQLFVAAAQMIDSYITQYLKCAEFCICESPGAKEVKWQFTVASFKAHFLANRQAQPSPSFSMEMVCLHSFITIEKRYRPTRSCDWQLMGRELIIHPGAKQKWCTSDAFLFHLIWTASPHFLLVPRSKWFTYQTTQLYMSLPAPPPDPHGENRGIYESPRRCCNRQLWLTCYEYWELNLSPPEEQYVKLVPEPPFQVQCTPF